MATSHSIESFTKEVLIDQLGEMVMKHRLLYLAVINITAGIEHLGACEDTLPFDTPGTAGDRFRLGVSAYLGKINPAYLPYNIKDDAQELYKHLRCGLLHILKPKGSVFGILGRSDAVEAGYKHLQYVPSVDKVLIVVEDFYDDFKEACELMISQLPSKNGSKFTDDFLPVRELPPFTTSISSAYAPLSGGN